MLIHRLTLTSHYAHLTHGQFVQMDLTPFTSWTLQMIRNNGTTLNASHNLITRYFNL
ncbi:MAG: hypothetical protein LZF86_40046 [Nitrospira sp.]|nr:MAG: hypothetical protein LZF86_40046 [Nitrospira sp.]